MLPKFSIVSIGAHTDVLNWVAKYKPVSVIIVNERGQSRPERPWETNEIDAMRWAMSASPKTLWIIRSWPDGIGEGELPLNYRVHKCFMPLWDLPNPKMGHSFNEPGFPWIGSSGDARRLEAMETGFAKYMHDAGLLSMNFCFSESHILKGNMGLWEIYADALPYVDALGFNEYDWRTVFTSRDQGYKWRTGHWEHQVDRIGQVMGTLDQIPPVIIGEGILDGKIWTNALPEGDPMRGRPYGYQKILGGQKYIKAHQDAYDDTYHKPGVFSHHTFCYCHPSSEWRSYSVRPILDGLGKLIQNQVYWADSGGGSMGVWDNVPPQIKQWKELIGKVTREHHVPIPDHKGVHISPAKLLACMIMKESSGNHQATNLVTGATGLMQIMPMHFRGAQDPYDPEWNIGAGLRDLERKLFPPNKPPRDLQKALFYYSGRAERSFQVFIERYWGFIVEKYKQFWGVDLEPEPQPNKAILEGIARVKSKAQGAKYLLEQIEEEADAIEEML